MRVHSFVMKQPGHLKRGCIKFILSSAVITIFIMMPKTVYVIMQLKWSLHTYLVHAGEVKMNCSWL